MTMAAAIDRRTADAPARPATSRIAHVDIVRDLGAAEATWRALDGGAQFATPYQRFDFLAAWQRHTGGGAPLVVIARDAEHNTLLLLPLILEHGRGIRTASFMGGKHATFNMPLWKREFAREATRADLVTLLSKLRAQDVADVLALTQQPLHWQDLVNPLSLLPHQPSVNECPLLTMELGADPASRISNSFRRRLKGKERKFQALPGYRYIVAETDAEVTRLLNWFFAVKPQRMAELGLPNVFAERGIEDFIRAACLTPLDCGGRVIDIHALACDEEIIAIYAGVADGQRFSMMFNTYTMSENARFSPGLILMRYIVDHYAGRGYRSLDLGIGSGEYKRLFCKSDEPIFDSYIALSPRGRLAAAAMSAVSRGKRLVKRNDTLLRLVQHLRHIFN
jgi:CelD/BcsL family acetyltransferase involved in cellulose biosynthesis